MVAEPDDLQAEGEADADFRERLKARLQKKMEAPILEKVMGIVFLTDPDMLRPEGVQQRGLHAEGIAWMDTDAFRELMGGYLGEPITLRQINDLVKEVVIYARQAGRPVVDVYMPAQDITSGTIQVVVIQARVGEIRVEGSNHFAAEQYLQQISLHPGEYIRSDVLTEDLKWIARNPFRRARIAFARGDESGETDLIIEAEDRSPWQFYTGYENTGNELTGKGRVFTGVQWGSVLGSDHRATYQFTADPSLGHLRLHSGSYTVPLPWRHILSGFASYAVSESETGIGIGITGESWQVGMRYEIPLLAPERFSELEHGLELGFDFKRTNNNIAFSGTTLLDSFADVAQAVLQYSASMPDTNGGTEMDILLAWSPGNLSKHNKDGDLQGIRQGAQAQYYYSRISLSRTSRLPWELSNRTTFTYQWSSENLMPSEQLGLGGADSVRGFEERVDSGDRGYLFRTEVLSPAIFPGRLRKETDAPVKWGTLQGLMFYDYGRVSDKYPLAGASRSTVISSAGAGIRYQLDSRFTFKLDYGKKVNRSTIVDPSSGRWHAFLLYRF